MKKRILSIFMALCMIASLFPVSALAEEPEIDVPVDESFTSTEALAAFEDVEPPHEHTYVPYVTEPSCTEQGYTTYICSCGDSYVSDYTDALKHPQTIDVPEIPATETSTGTTAGTKCAVCGELLSGGEEIPMLQSTKKTEAGPEAAELDTGREEEVSGVQLEEETAKQDAKYGIIASGTCGDNLTWSLNEEGKLTISGYAAMDDYSYDYSLHCINQPWYGETGQIKSIVFSGSVTSIGKNAFCDCSGLTSVTIAESVTSIGDFAFSGCNGLTSVTIPDGVTSIGDFAFSGCSGLTSVTIPDGVTSIGDFAFQGCNGLTSVTIPENVTRCSDAFNDCSRLTSAGPIGSGCSIEFGWTTSIPGYAFCNCSGLTSVTIPDGVTSIGDNAFEYCISLTSVTIPRSITSIGDYAFCDCSGLTSVTMPDGVTTIGACTFCGCISLTSVTIPESVTSIRRNAFCDCSGLTSVTIPDGVTSIDDSAFASCSGLTSMTIPDGVTSIGYSAFSNCSGLTSVTIPESVTSIGENAFQGCNGLTSVTIPGSVISIGFGTFKLCGNLTHVKILEGVTSIEESAFEKCASLTDVTIPKSVRYIGIFAFNNGENDNSITDVCYGGSITEWNGITIERGNSQLLSAEIHYNSSGGDSRVPIIDLNFKLDGDENPIREIRLRQEIEKCVSQTPSTTYNPELSYYLCGLCRAVYNDSCIRRSLENLGFKSEDIEPHIEDTWWDLDAEFVLAKKDLEDGSTFVMVVVEGTGTFGEWLTDFTLGESTIPSLNCRLHQGFSRCTDAVVQMLKRFLGGIPTANVTYVITGHSLGAAVGNLVSVSLLNKGVPQANLYSYNYACPDVALGHSNDWNPGGVYNNIFNIADVRDIVAVIPGAVAKELSYYTYNKSVFLSTSTWGKFGVSRWFSVNNWSSTHILSTGPHDLKNYLAYLCTEPGLNSFRTWIDSRNIVSIVQNAKNYFSHFFCCPVDVVVYDNSGTPVASVIDGVANYHGCSYGDVVILTSGDEKVIAVPDDGQYTVKLTGTDDGEMTYAVVRSDLAAAEANEEKSFESVALAAGKTMSSRVGVDIEVSDIKLYVTEEDGLPIAEVQEDGTEIERGQFNDVNDPNAYYYTPVYWAVGRGITAGTSPTTFSPSNPCTRGQIVTFLWKAMGSPEPTSLNNPFNDVSSDDYFYKPVLWAKENGITSGKTATTFEPYSTCTRGQIVTFLWIAKGRPEPSTMKNPFTDVAETDYFFKPILWAKESGITSGTSATTFSPYNPCTRAQAMTFLYKAMH